MPIRGSRSIYPNARTAPTGIFSTRGKQKNDPVSGFDERSTQKYAHKHTRKLGKCGTKQNGPISTVRHQAPKKGY